MRASPTSNRPCRTCGSTADSPSAVYGRRRRKDEGGRTHLATPRPAPPEGLAARRAPQPDARHCTNDNSQGTMTAPHRKPARSCDERTPTVAPAVLAVLERFLPGQRHPRQAEHRTVATADV